MLFEASELLINIFVVVVGLFIGSFLNVVIYRVPRDESIAFPGSHCPKCGGAIRFYENIPVLSYLALRGKCRHCKTAIPFRYPLVELLTGLVFLALKIRFGFSYWLFLKDFPFAAILIAVTFIDLDHRIIPDRLSLGGLVWGLVLSFFDPSITVVQSVSGAIAGFTFFYAIAWYYEWRTGKMGLGGGDIKLIAMIGAFIGPLGVLTTIFISSIVGSVFGIVLAVRQKSRPNVLEGEVPEGLMKYSLPYGPFLVLGGLYYHLLGEILWHPFMNLM